ncbi:hypothetical protein [Streptomyces mirabilis]|uniref:hypothetical protein n=1 Tax=Streptomyces mirabilis TaxID=68239 RepID=UPI00210B0B7F|nr:hypothetical protein [Streptomyces mirabilis]
MLFLDDEEHEDQLRRCLTDASLPLELRIVGALIRLYGLPLIRIVRLTTDGFHQDEREAYFTFDKDPVLLPPTLARLIEQQITTGRSRAALGPLATSEHSGIRPWRGPRRPGHPVPVAGPEPQPGRQPRPGRDPALQVVFLAAAAAVVVHPSPRGGLFRVDLAKPERTPTLALERALDRATAA